MTIRYLPVLALTLSLAACDGGGSSSTSALVDACEAQANVPPGLCDCVGEEAEELTPEERKFVIASLQKDKEAAAAARQELGFTDLTRASMFFLTATQNCAAALPE